MAAWHETRKPGLGRNAWLGVAFGIYLTAMLVLVAWIVWKVAHPLPHLIP